MRIFKHLFNWPDEYHGRGRDGGHEPADRQSSRCKIRRSQENSQSDLSAVRTRHEKGAICGER